MTRPDQKVAEREAIAEFLQHWCDGAQWRLLEEGDVAEAPDAILCRHDRTEAVALEVTRYIFAPLARADVVGEEIANEVADALCRSGKQHLGVFLSFYEASALAIGTGRDRVDKVRRIADFICSRTPIADSINIRADELEDADVPAVHGITMFPAEELFVIKAGTTGHGVGVQVIQPHIDAKAGKLADYHANGHQRVTRAAPGCRFGGVWLVVTVFDGKGISGSVLTRDAEQRLDAAGFDRAFLLDRWEGESRRVVELPPRRSSP